MKILGAAAAVAVVVVTAPSWAQSDEPDTVSPPPLHETRDGPDAQKATGDEPPQADAAGRLVAYARKLREDKGCAAAAPAYRVVAGMGEGQEPAQGELGECLLDMKGASDTETALFRQEGQFWLTRAAFAGDARAQRRLVVEMASPASSLHNPKGALMWALIYDKNPTADLYGYKALPPTLTPGLKSSLNAADVSEVETFAAQFTPLLLAKYEGPKSEKRKRGESGFGEGGPQKGQRRRHAF